MLGPAADRRGHLLRVGGGEDEDDVARGLLERLQQGVRRRGREHVHLVDDVDLPAPRGAQAGVRHQIAHGVDAVVRGRVELVHVERAPLGDLDARGADAAWLTVDGRLAIERLGQDPRRRRLAGPPGSAEEIGMRHPVVSHGAAQRPHHVVLTPDLVESPGPEAAVEGDEGGVGHDRRAYPRALTVESGRNRILRSSASPRRSVRRPGWLRHPAIPAESCCLPTLTRFTSGRCAGPGHRTQHRDGETVQASGSDPSGSLHGGDAGAVVRIGPDPLEVGILLGRHRREEVDRVCRQGLWLHADEPALSRPAQLRHEPRRPVTHEDDMAAPRHTSLSPPTSLEAPRPLATASGSPFTLVRATSAFGRRPLIHVWPIRRRLHAGEQRVS